MAFYEIEWKQSAKKELRKLSNPARRRILAAVEGLRENPHPPGSRKLVGADHAYRIRVGSYRVVYTLFKSVLRLEVVRVGHRKDVYR